MAQVLCPKCGAPNEEAPGGAPFFCVKCREVVDPSGKTRSTSAPPPASAGMFQHGPEFVSQRGTTKPLTATGPGAGVSVGGAKPFGYVLAAIASVVVTAGLAWVGVAYFRIPLLYPLAAGWAIKRALAIGSGGGTPDRGFVGAVLLVAIVAAGYLAGLFIDYRAVERHESRHYLALFGPDPLRDPSAVVRELVGRADSDGNLQIDVDGKAVTVNMDHEEQRLRKAAATGKPADRPYDIALLAATGRTGFVGHLDYLVKEGTTFRFTPTSTGYEVPGAGVVAWWLMELAVMLVAAFLRVD